jgi:fumarate reductase subunit C
MSRRPYVRKFERSWWLAHPRYVAYMIREITSLFIVLYCALLVVGLVRLAQGPAAWEGLVAALSRPLNVVFQLVCLAFATYHSVTWFALAPKAMPLVLKGERVPSKTIVAAHYVAWAAVSLVVLIGVGI